MNITRFMIFAASLLTAASLTASELQIKGGTLWVGAELQSDEVMVDGLGTLGGTGTVAAGRVGVSGTVSPGSSSGAQGALSFSSNVVFQPGSFYDCDVASSTSVDRLNIRGAAGGQGTVRVSNPSGAIPVDQVIIDGGDSSGYGSFQTIGAGLMRWGLAENPPTDLSLTRLDGDTDGNGLPDWWELAWFGQRTGTDPDGHGDADGVPNEEEYLAGTDPTDETSVLQLTWIERDASGGISMGWSSTNSPWLNVPSSPYRVEATTNIIEDGFIALSGNLSPTPPENVYTNAVSADYRLYRVVIP